MTKIFTLLLSMSLGMTALAANPTKAPVDGYPDFAMGGDLSWTTRIVDGNIYTYYLGNTIASDQITTIPEMVYDHGFDAVRLRVWVDPSANSIICGNDNWEFNIGSSTFNCTSTHGYCGTDDLVALATTFANQGARIMVAFHLSDTFADPARQFIPTAWQDCTTIEEWVKKASEYVAGVLQKLYDANVNVAWVQIGNETRTGMLKYKLPTTSGATVSQADLNCEISTSNTTGTKNFISVFNACATAAKSIYPNAKTLIHLDSGDEWSKINWTLNTLKSQGFSSDYCDMIGLSLYPCPEQKTSAWQTRTDKCLETIEKVYDTYGYRTIICEIGMNNEWTSDSENATQAQGIALCNADVADFTQYLIDNLREKESTCDGFFYWEPEVDYLDEYKMGACVSANPGSSWPRDKVTANDYWATVKDNSTFPAGGLTDYEHAGIAGVEIDNTDAPIHYYNLQGIEVNQPQKGFFIKRQGSKSEKVILR